MGATGAQLDARYGFHLLEIVDMVQDKITEPIEDNTRFPREDLYRQIQMVIWEMLEDDLFPFMQTTINSASEADQVLYNFPSTLAEGSTVEVRFLDTYYKSLSPIDWKTISDLTTEGTPHSFYVKDGKIGYYPVYGSTTADVFQTTFHRLHPELTTGTAQAATGTTIILDADEVPEDDYYNGMVLAITGGTGSGQTRKVTDYTGSTKTCTVSTWTTNPDSTSTYSFYPLIPPSSQRGIISGAAGYLLGKNRNTQERAQDFLLEFEMAKKKLREISHGSSRETNQLQPYTLRGSHAPYHSAAWYMNQ